MQECGVRLGVTHASLTSSLIPLIPGHDARAGGAKRGGGTRMSGVRRAAGHQAVARRWRLHRLRGLPGVLLRALARAGGGGRR